MNLRIQGGVFAAILAAGCLPLVAQDFEKTGPKTPPSDATPAQLPEKSVPASAGSQEVMVKQLKGLVFVRGMEQVQKSPPNVKGIRTNGIAMLENKDFPAVAKPYLGKPVTMDRLNALIRDVILYYRRHDRPVVDVVVPEQEITGGVIQVVVLEGKVGKVSAEGNKWFCTKSIEGEVRLHPGGPISAKKLLQDVAWLNRNPFRSTDVVFTPGKETGSTDIVLQTTDRFPVRFYAGYEDSGNDLTGYERWYTGFNWGDAFFLGHQLNYQFTTSSDFEELTAHSGSYIAPLPWRHVLTVFGASSSTSGDVPGFDLNGAGAQLGGRYEIPLPAITAHYQQSLIFGYDWKQSDNSLEFGPTPVNASTTDTGQFVFAYKGTLIDDWGSFSISPQVYWSPFGLWDHQTNADYASVRPGASPDYAYFRLDLSRVTQLPWNFSLINELTWQVVDTNMLPSEQMNMGGFNAVRGYDDRNLSNTDEGWVVRNELRTPPVSLLQFFKNDKLRDQLQFLFFFDFGVANAYAGPITLNNGKSVSEVPMGGIGPGIRYSVNSWLSVRADYGFQLYDTGEDRSGRWHLGVMLVY
jgi:hemolysin activation/secretion protein